MQEMTRLLCWLLVSSQRFGSLFRDSSGLRLLECFSFRLDCEERTACCDFARGRFCVDVDVDEVFAIEQPIHKNINQ
jgi:hypothetical protein